MCSRTAGSSIPRLWLAPPPAPSPVRSAAWKAISSPRANTDCTMTRGPVTGCWTSTPPPAKTPSLSYWSASRRSCPVVVTWQTPAEAVPIGVFTNTGSGPADPSSALLVAMVAGGCGRPSRVRVAKAVTLSCTAASAVKSGTAVSRPAARSRCAATDMTATCSWVGNSTSA